MMRGLSVLVLSASLTLGAGCGEADVIVATTYATADASAFDGGPGQTCMTDHDCLAIELCARTTCSDVTGVCARRPTLCDNGLKPVCGCDGVTYWNDCLRKQSGASTSTAGECSGSFAACGGVSNMECPTGATCNRLVPGPGNDCNLSPVGACWVLPDECPASSSVPPLKGCPPDPPTCTDVCAAIESGNPYQSGKCD